MGRFQDLRQRMRGDLHREMSVSAFYLVNATAAPVPCDVRVWLKGNISNGSLPGFHGAERAETEDQIRFRLCDGFRPRRLGLVTVKGGDGFRIELMYRPDGDWQTARVIPLSADEMVGLPVPE